jgi:probable F420-dependent oxidoreductase
VIRTVPCLDHSGDEPVRLTLALRNFAAEPPCSWAHLAEFARAADDAGVHRLVLSDHVVMGEDLAAYGDPSGGGTAGGLQPTGPDGHWLEPLTTIAWLVAQTTQVRFGTNVLLAALRGPAVLAKTAATLDVLSGGRLDLGVGVGWQAAEYDAVGMPFTERGRLLDQTLEVCQALWRQTAVSYEGDGLSLARVHQMPKPVQAGRVPVWVSGTVHRRSMRRLARFGTGWIPWGPDAADVPAGVARMRRAVAAEGRNADDIAVLGTLAATVDAVGAVDAAATAHAAGALSGAGVTDVLLRLPLPLDQTAASHRLEDVVAALATSPSL